MFQYKKIFIAIILSIALIAAIVYFSQKNHRNSHIPLVAIANWGPHSSLEETIQGIKEELQQEGFIEGENIRIKIADAGFDTALIPQMVMQLKGLNPKAIVMIATPVAQFVKSAVKDTPLVFSDITDPVEAGLLKEENQPQTNITGASDKQNLGMLLEFAKKLIPNAKRVGVLFSTSEVNDAALVKMLKEAAEKIGMSVVALPINQARDVPMQMKFFKGAVDFIYVGASGPIQPTLPAIAAEADKMGIPIFNVNEDAVKKNQVLASYGVDYKQVGINTGKLVAAILKGENIANLKPIYPSSKDHYGFISRRKAKDLHIEIPSDLKNTQIGE